DHDRPAPQFPGLHGYHGSSRIGQDPVAAAVHGGDHPRLRAGVPGALLRPRPGTPARAHPDVVLGVTAGGPGHQRLDSPIRWPHRPGKSGMVLAVVSTFTISTPGTARPITAAKVAKTGRAHA